MSDSSNYYCGAIINNIGNKDNMRKTVWASLMHCLSTDQDPQHNNCPMSSDTWCFFNNALTEDRVPPLHKENMKHFYQIQLVKHCSLYIQG